MVDLTYRPRFTADLDEIYDYYPNEVEAVRMVRADRDNVSGLIAEELN